MVPRRTKGAAFALLFSVFSTMVPAGTAALDTAVSIPSQTRANILFKITRADLHRVRLNISTTGTPDWFYLRYPDGTYDRIGSDDLAVSGPGPARTLNFNTHAMTPFGRNIELTEDGPTYSLKVSQNSAGPGIDYLAQDEIWGLTIISAAASDVTATLDGDSDADESSYTHTSLAALYPGSLVWVSDTLNAGDIKIYFHVPDEIQASGDNDDIHMLELDVYAEDPPASFYLRYPESTGGDPGRPISDGTDTDVGRWHIGFDDNATHYTLQIRRLPDGTINPADRETFGENGLADNDWILGLNGVEGNHGVAVKGIRVYDRTETEIDIDAVQVESMPVAAITEPFDRPVGFPCKLMKDRAFHYRSFTDNQALSGIPDYGTNVSYSWTYQGGAEFSASENPATPTAYGDYGDKNVVLTVTETIDVPNDTADLVYTVEDTISFDIIPPVVTAFPRYYGVPVPTDGGFAWSGPPEIDGIVTDPVVNSLGSQVVPRDANWNQSYKYTYHYGGSSPETVFQCVRQKHAYSSLEDEDFFLLSFEVYNDDSLNDGDSIVLCFRPNAAGSTPDPMDDRRVFVHPFPSSGGTTVNAEEGDDVYNGELGEIRVWRNSSSWTEIEAVDLPAIQGKVRSLQTGAGNFMWAVELKIPTTAAAGVTNWVDFAEEFLFYFNVIRTDPANEMSAQAVWPREAAIINGGRLENYAFPATEWSRGYQGDDPDIIYKGVSLDASSIRTSNADIHDIEVPPAGETRTNTFQAVVQNSTERENPGTGLLEYPGAAGVTARFFIANWGLPSEASWREVGSDTENLDGADSDTGEPSSRQYETDWTLTHNGTDLTESRFGGTVNEYLDPSNKHQCIYVELFSEIEDVNFVQKSAYRNMDFHTASVFRQRAEVSAEGYGAPLDGAASRRFFIRVTTREWEIAHEKDDHPPYLRPYLSEISRGRMRQSKAAAESGSSSGGGSSYIDWTAHGVLYLGPGLIINGRSYDVVRDIGSFTHIVEHDEEVCRWEQEIEEAVEVAKNLYFVDVPVGGAKSIFARIKPIEPLGVLLSLHGGIALPVPPSAFFGDYGTGVCLVANLGYEINDRWSAIGLFGWNRFPGKATGIDDTSLLNIAANIKYFLPLGRRMRLGLGIGPEMYIQDLSAVDFGYDVDLSCDWRPKKLLTLEIGALYHSHFDQEVWFLHTHAGLILRF